MGIRRLQVLDDFFMVGETGLEHVTFIVRKQC